MVNRNNQSNQTGKKETIFTKLWLTIETITEHRTTIFHFIEVLLIASLGLSVIFITGLFAISYIRESFLGYPAWAQQLYVPIKKLMRFLHTNWLTTITILLLLFYRAIYKFIEEVRIIVGWIPSKQKQPEGLGQEEKSPNPQTKAEPEKVGQEEKSPNPQTKVEKTGKK